MQFVTETSLNRQTLNLLVTIFVITLRVGSSFGDLRFILYPFFFFVCSSKCRIWKPIVFSRKKVVLREDDKVHSKRGLIYQTHSATDEFIKNEFEERISKK